MEPGDHFDSAGYEILAHANTDNGVIQVLSNNSSHFLVVEFREDFDIYDVDTVMLLKSYQYGGSFPNYDCHEAYAIALSFMVNSALSRSKSLRS